MRNQPYPVARCCWASRPSSNNDRDAVRGDRRCVRRRYGRSGTQSRRAPKILSVSGDFETAPVGLNIPGRRDARTVLADGTRQRDRAGEQTRPTPASTPASSAAITVQDL